MGQKTNSILYRVGTHNHEWGSKYIEKISEEISCYYFYEQKIKYFINRLFKKQGLLINSCKINIASHSVEVFLSFFTTLKSIVFIERINLNQKIKTKLKYVRKKKKRIYKYGRVYVFKKSRRKRLRIITRRKIDYYKNKWLKKKKTFTK